MGKLRALNRSVSGASTGLLTGGGAILIWLLVVAAIIMLTVFFIKGAVWASLHVLPVLNNINAVLLVLTLVVLVPLAIFRRTRATAGSGMILVSYAVGLALWLWSLLLTYALWGMMAVLIGLFLFGVGIFPVALLATAFKGLWLQFFGLLVVLVIAFGLRIAGAFLVAKAEVDNA